MDVTVKRDDDDDDDDGNDDKDDAVWLGTMDSQEQSDGADE